MVAADGHTYERSSLLRWQSRSGVSSPPSSHPDGASRSYFSSPLTNRLLPADPDTGSSSNLFPNRAIHSQVQAHRHRLGVELRERCKPLNVARWEDGGVRVLALLEVGGADSSLSHTASEDNATAASSAAAAANSALSDPFPHTPLQNLISVGMLAPLFIRRVVELDMSVLPASTGSSSNSLRCSALATANARRSPQPLVGTSSEWSELSLFLESAEREAEEKERQALAARQARESQEREQQARLQESSRGGGEGGVASLTFERFAVGHFPNIMSLLYQHNMPP